MCVSVYARMCVLMSVCVSSTAVGVGVGGSVCVNGKCGCRCGSVCAGEWAK